MEDGQSNLISIKVLQLKGWEWGSKQIDQGWEKNLSLYNINIIQQLSTKTPAVEQAKHENLN